MKPTIVVSNKKDAYRVVVAFTGGTHIRGFIRKAEAVAFAKKQMAEGRIPRIVDSSFRLIEDFSKLTTSRYAKPHIGRAHEKAA